MRDKPQPPENDQIVNEKIVKPKGSIRTVLSYPELTLHELKLILSIWITKYGKDAVLTTDARYNNVKVNIDNRVKIYEKTEK